jgi:hypothetical protein
VEYAVYIALPPGEDADPIARTAATLTPPEVEFSIREDGDPSESTVHELSFRVAGVDHPDQAMAKALRIYARARAAAGLPPDGRGCASLEPGPSRGAEEPTR